VIGAEKKIPDKEIWAFLHAIDREEITLVSDGDPPHAGDFEYLASNGWRIVVFFDCPEFDYIDSIVADDGRRWEYGLPDEYYDDLYTENYADGTSAQSKWPPFPEHYHPGTDAARRAFKLRY
jgi:hypothetical protein